MNCGGGGSCGTCIVEVSYTTNLHFSVSMGIYVVLFIISPVASEEKYNNFSIVSCYIAHAGGRRTGASK